MSKAKKQTKRTLKKDAQKENEILEGGAGIAFKETVDMETYAYEGRRATVDEPIPLGVVPDINVLPKRMRAWVIRRERHGDPMESFQEEVMPVPEVGPNDVLVLVMAAGVNYNGVWAGLGQPISVLDVHKRNFHIAGSDAAGIVWRVGPNVRS